MSFATRAAACDDWIVRGHVAGVASDGAFVYVRTTNGYTSCSRATLEVYDGTTHLAGSYAQGADDDDCEAWATAGNVPMAPPAKASAAELERLVAGALRLQPLAESPRKIAVVQSTAVCARFDLVAPWGQAPVWELTEGERGQCAKMHARTFAHPASSLLFMTYGYARPSECPVSIEDVYWIPASRIEATRAVAEGKRQLERRHPKSAAEWFRKAALLDPAYVSTRILLADALLAAHTPWTEAALLLTLPYAPDGQRCLGGTAYEYTEHLASDEFAEWQEDGAFEAWMAAEVARHPDGHGGDNPQDDSKWRR